MRALNLPLIGIRARKPYRKRRTFVYVSMNFWECTVIKYVDTCTRMDKRGDWNVVNSHACCCHAVHHLVFLGDECVFIFWWVSSRYMLYEISRGAKFLDWHGWEWQILAKCPCFPQFWHFWPLAGHWGPSSSGWAIHRKSMALRFASKVGVTSGVIDFVAGKVFCCFGRAFFVEEGS